MLAKYFPILQWGKSYNRSALIADVTAAIIVTIMLIPQSMAYALLAGLPPEAGIYASIVPILLYSIFGTSSSLAVGPVAVLSLMIATTIGAVTADGSVDYSSAALTLAFLSGLMLIVFGIFRFGFLSNYLSHPVIAGFIRLSFLGAFWIAETIAIIQLQFSSRRYDCKNSTGYSNSSYHTGCMVFSVNRDGG